MYQTKQPAKTALPVSKEKKRCRRDTKRVRKGDKHKNTNEDEKGKIFLK